MGATFSAAFIDIEYLTDMTPMGSNLDPLQVAPFILEAQDVYIQDILGTPLYDNLCYNIYINNGSPTWTSDENIIVELASKCLAYYTTYMAIPHMAIKIRNSGVVRTQADNIVQTSMEEVRYIREEVKNLGEFYSQRLINYLCDNSNKYPLYNVTGDMKPTSTQYDCDLYLDNLTNFTNEERKFLNQYYYRR